MIPVLAASAVFYLTGKSGKKYESQASLYINLPTNEGLSITNEGFKQHEIAAYIQDLILHTESSKSMEYVALSILKDYLEGKNALLNASETSFPWTDSAAVTDRIEYLFAANEMMDVRRELDATMTIFLRDQGLTTQSIRNLYHLYRQGSSNYLRLKTSSGDPFISAYVGELVIESMFRLNKGINRDKIEADTRLFEKLVAEAKLELDVKVAKLEDYKIENSVINLPEHTKAIVNQIVEIEIQRAQLIELAASKEQGIAELREKIGLNEELPLDLNSNERYIELRNRIREFSSQRNNENQIRRDFTLAEIEDTRIEIQELMEEYVEDVPIDIRKARQELTQHYLNYQVDLEMTKEMIPLVQAELDRINEYAKTFAPLESNIGTYEREIYTAQETYLILVNKLNLAKTVAQGTGVNELVVIDSPSVPLLPVPSKRKILILMSAVLTFIIIVFLIAAIEYLDSGVWSARDFEHIFKAEPYATLPNLGEADKTNDESLFHYLNVLFVQQVKSVAIKIDSFAESNEKEVVLISSLDGEGKKALAQSLQQEMNYLGYNTAVYSYNQFEEKETLVPFSMAGEEPRITIHVLPAASIITSWQKWLRTENIFLWMYHAGRAPLPSDPKVLEALEGMNAITILNKVSIDYLEDSGVHVTKNRSFARVWVKRILNLQFKAKNLEVSK
ncbi:MAG: hypothetical protein MI700_03945 [Balneolales bacterium]|nr:hypothetical protein [Balneolales bacterium]